MVIEFDISKMCNWEIQKAGYLLSVAGELGMDLQSYGQVAVNPNSGYTYLWLEDYNFTLYMPISCELVRSDVYVLHTNSEDGTETEIKLESLNLSDIEDWVEAVEGAGDLGEVTP